MATEPVIRFRNYTPRDATLGESAQMTTADLPSAKAGASLRDDLSRATAAAVRVALARARVGPALRLHALTTRPLPFAHRNRTRPS